VLSRAASEGDAAADAGIGEGDGIKWSIMEARAHGWRINPPPPPPLPPPPPNHLHPRVQVRCVRSVIDRCLEADPLDRATVADLLESDFLRETVLERRVREDRAIAAAAPPPAPAPAPSPPPHAGGGGLTGSHSTPALMHAAVGTGPSLLGNTDGGSSGGGAGGTPAPAPAPPGGIPHSHTMSALPVLAASTPADAPTEPAPAPAPVPAPAPAPDHGHSHAVSAPPAPAPAPAPVPAPVATRTAVSNGLATLPPPAVLPSHPPAHPVGPTGGVGGVIVSEVALPPASAPLGHHSSVMPGVLVSGSGGGSNASGPTSAASSASGAMSASERDKFLRPATHLLGVAVSTVRFYSTDWSVLLNLYQHDADDKRYVRVRPVKFKVHHADVKEEGMATVIRQLAYHMLQHGLIRAADTDRCVEHLFIALMPILCFPNISDLASLEPAQQGETASSWWVAAHGGGAHRAHADAAGFAKPAGLTHAGGEDGGGVGPSGRMGALNRRSTMDASAAGAPAGGHIAASHSASAPGGPPGGTIRGVGVSGGRSRTERDASAEAGGDGNESGEEGGTEADAVPPMDTSALHYGGGGGGGAGGGGGSGGGGGHGGGISVGLYADSEGPAPGLQPHGSAASMYSVGSYPPPHPGRGGVPHHVAAGPRSGYGAPPGSALGNHHASYHDRDTTATYASVTSSMAGGGGGGGEEDPRAAGADVTDGHVGPAGHFVGGGGGAGYGYGYGWGPAVAATPATGTLARQHTLGTPMTAGPHPGMYAAGGGEVVPLSMPADGPTGPSGQAYVVGWATPQGPPSHGGGVAGGPVPHAPHAAYYPAHPGQDGGPGGMAAGASEDSAGGPPGLEVSAVPYGGGYYVAGPSGDWVAPGGAPVPLTYAPFPGHGGNPSAAWSDASGGWVPSPSRGPPRTSSAYGGPPVQPAPGGIGSMHPSSGLSLNHASGSMLHRARAGTAASTASGLAELASPSQPLTSTSAAAMGLGLGLGLSMPPDTPDGPIVSPSAGMPPARALSGYGAGPHPGAAAAVVAAHAAAAAASGTPGGGHRSLPTEWRSASGSVHPGAQPAPMYAPHPVPVGHGSGSGMGGAPGGSGVAPGARDRAAAAGVGPAGPGSSAAVVGRGGPVFTTAMHPHAVGPTGPAGPGSVGAVASTAMPAGVGVGAPLTSVHEERDDAAGGSDGEGSVGATAAAGSGGGSGRRAGLSPGGAGAGGST
jgi:hypothetical protein